MAKYQYVHDLLEKRVIHGDYALQGLPTEERIASEVGVSRMTARRAVQRLIDRGLLVRLPNGRVTVNRSSDSAVAAKQVAVLQPAFVSAEFETWRTAVEHAATKKHTQVRVVQYVHWDDPVVMDVFDSFDGVFVIASTEAMPDEVLERLVSRDTPFVMLDSDWSAQGVRSIDLMPASHVRTLLDHLADLGHERIACFNTQSEDRAIRGRIGQWEQWMREKGFSGRMINEPVPPYRESRAQAYQTMSNFLQARTPDFTAVFCTTGMCAAGLMRALHDAKIAIGSQLSVCAANDERWAPYLYPTLTSTRMPDPEPFIEVALEWMQSPGESWRKPNVLWPKSATLYIGESTGPAPA